MNDTRTITEEPRHDAACTGDQEAVGQILVAAAPMDSVDASSESATCVASQQEQKSGVEVLLEAGADVKAAHAIALRGLYVSDEGTECTSIIDFLLAADVDTNWLDHCQTDLRKAVNEGYESVAYLILQYADDIIRQNDHGNTAVHYPSRYEGEWILDVLLEYLDVTMPRIDPQHNTALHYASQCGYDAVVEVLLKRGADINALNRMCETAIHYASKRGHESVVDVLLKRGADINGYDYIGETALHNASRCGHESVVNVFMKHGADVNGPINVDVVALLCASAYGNCSVDKVLSKSGMDRNERVNNGNAALYWASEFGRRSVVEILLKCGANVNAQNYDGNTALHVASESGFESVVETLLKWNADINQVNSDGVTPLACASSFGTESVIEVLLKYGANINSTDSYYYTALHCATNSGNLSTVTFLLQHGADMNITNYMKKTPPMMSHSKQIKKTFMQHILKMIGSNQYICSENLDWFRRYCEDTAFDHSVAECREESRKLTNEIIGNSSVRYWDILMKDTRQLALLARNEDIARALETKDYAKKFPIYAEFIDSQLKKGQERASFWNTVLNAVAAILVCMSDIPLPELVIDKIVSYLSKEDLENLQRLLI